MEFFDDRDQRGGWAEPTGRANARPMINSAILINCIFVEVMGFAGLNLSTRSPDAAQRAALAAWCAADPGSILPLDLLWVPALRSNAKGAAPRPGHERNLLSPLSSDLPVGLFVDRAVESFISDFPKNICSL